MEEKSSHSDVKSYYLYVSPHTVPQIPLRAVVHEMYLKLQCLEENYVATLPTAHRLQCKCCHLFRDPIKQEESGGTDDGLPSRHRQYSLFLASTLQHGNIGPQTSQQSASQHWPTFHRISVRAPTNMSTWTNWSGFRRFSLQYTR